MARFNLEEADLSLPPDRPDGFRVRRADIGPAVGGEHLAGTLVDIPPGERAWPYHWEAAEEEWLIVLAGTPTVRTPEGEEVLAAGDVVCFPAGPEGAHQVRNGSDAPCRIVMLSNHAPVNVVIYGDSDKVGVRTPWLRPNLPQRPTVDYWEGE